MAKPLKFHQTLNQPPRSAKHGSDRKSSPTTHSHSAVRTSDSTGGSDAWITASTGTTFYFTREDPKPPTVPFAGIRTGELIGHRLWWVLEDNQLCSLAHYRPWVPGETVSGDIQEAIFHDPLVGQITIWGGVYSYLSGELAQPQLLYCISFLEELRKLYGTSIVSLGSDLVTMKMIHVCGVALGTIKMWGDVIEHETGYRAEYAKLHSIDEVHGADIDELRRKYGV